MGKYLKSALIFIAFFIGNDQAFSGASSSVRDARQFRFGFEPTLTNIPILWENGKAIIKKAVTGKGEGVLSTEMPVGNEYRERYMKYLKEQCPECVIKSLYDSHGELTYQIEYPDGYYIRSSTDAGALEWQTKPSTLPEIKKHTALHQRDIFDQAKNAGIKRRIKITGGHTTFSGFGNDTFWYGNYLKFRTKNTDLDWGFFGKDGYNATPVQLWDPKQQERYGQVHAEHDQKWEKFLKELESGLQNKVSDAELIRIYQNRDLMPIEEYSGKLLEIYHNPKQENARLGKRSKPKYVAQRPFMDLIENRAINPQANAEEMLKMAEFMEAEAWYVKEKLNHNLQVDFTPQSFTPNSKKTAAQNSRKVIEGVGMKWKDYVRFSKVGDVKLTGQEKNIIDDFTPKSYGAGKRDALFRKLRNRFLSKRTLTREEGVFLADLLNEMSYTIPDAIENTQLLQKKVPISMIQEFSTEEANAFVKNANKLANKFPAASKEVLAPVQDHLKTFLIRTMHEGQQDARSLIPLVESKKAVLNEMIRLRKLNPNMQQWGMYADLVLSQPKDIQGSKEYLKAIVSQMNRGGLTEVPSRFHEIAMKVDDPEAIDAIAGWLSDPKNSHLKNVGSDAELLHWIAEKKPEQKNKIFAPLREYYANKIAENNFGRKDFYKTTILFDHLNEIVPESEKKEFLQNMLNKVHSAFPEVEHPDRLIFSEKIEKYLNQDLQPVSRGSCLTRFSSQLKQIFRK